MILENAGDGVERGAGGHDVIDDDHGEAGQVAAAGEGMPDVGATAALGQAALRQGFPGAGEAGAVDGECQRARQGAGDFQRLIEATFFQSFGRQGHGQNQCAVRVRASEHAADEELGAGETAPVLQLVRQCVNRKAVAQVTS